MKEGKKRKWEEERQPNWERERDRGQQRRRREEAEREHRMHGLAINLLTEVNLLKSTTKKLRLESGSSFDSSIPVC